ncbi:hypothetical protein V8E54_011372 [Elaphomyces granulatus]
MSQESIGNRNQPVYSPEITDLDLEEVFGSSQQLPKSSEIRRRGPSSRSTSSEQDSQNSGAKLKDLLAINSVVSTASSFAEKHQAAIDTKASFRQIGRGACGPVFERPGTTFALKLAKTDSDALWNDYEMHMIRIQ